MLKRIKDIKNIGCFKDCHSPEAEFNKLTLIFGRNTYGKSTLADLLSSIKSGDVSFIIKRKTISNSGEPSSQSATIQFKLQDNTSPEEPIILKNNNWNRKIPNIYVFNDDFSHKNLFLGKKFTKDTKENFSDLVLGEQGVRKAEEIKDKKKQKEDSNRALNNLKVSFKNIQDIDNFISVPEPIDSKDSLITQAKSLENTIFDLHKQEQNRSQIEKRNELKPLDWKLDIFLDELHKFNKVLSLSLENYHEEAKVKVEEHIKNSFKNCDDDAAENWIKRGIADNDGLHCQFCGQTLSKDALSLLDIYRQYFDDSYDKHEINIGKELSSTKEVLEKERIEQLQYIIDRNEMAIANYPELENTSDFSSFKEKIKKSSLTTLIDLFDKWKTGHFLFKGNIERAVAQKNLSPHKAYPEVKADDLLCINELIAESIGNYHTVIAQLNGIIKAFKESHLNGSLTQQINEAKQNKLDVERKLLRLNLNEECISYRSLKQEINALGEDISKLERELEQEQSEFLDKFFQLMNGAFKKFGSHNFSLEKCAGNKRAHKPTYHLQVKFHGNDIKEDSLDVLFSESDRRALALALFWATLGGLDETTKCNAIVVLDDPVTSFDLSRMMKTHKEIVCLADQVRQVIILSHFEDDIVRFLTTYHKKEQLTFLSIEKDKGFSKIKKEDISYFIRTTHEKNSEDIFKFISGESNDFDVKNLRVFLESEINMRFAKQIRDKNINDYDLNTRITKLEEEQIISGDTKNELHRWREMLNPEHHNELSLDIEDRRNTAQEFVNFIYHDLVPK